MIHFAKEKTSLLSLRGITWAAVLSAVLLLSGCSGTGTMYTPESEESSFSASTGSTSAAESAAEAASGGAGAEAGSGSGHDSGHSMQGEDPDEETRVRSRILEGIGSDLFTSETVDYYYTFNLESTDFHLPCSYSDFDRSGWKLVLPETEAGSSGNNSVPYYSFEFYDAVLSGDGSSGPVSGGDSQKKIRLCLANFTDHECPPELCTVCGISLTADSGFTFLTSFKEGIGSSLDDLTAVFGTDNSIYSLSEYADGSKIVKYRFSNGLTEGQEIRVLAEAEAKSLGELMIAETDESGITVEKLSLFYFRISD